MLIGTGLIWLLLSPPAQAQADEVRIARIDNEIELGVAAYLKRVLAEADADGVRAVVLEINTPGGRLDAALEMRSAILGAEVETIAFINREAFSAGALIAISADRIYMTPGAVMGAATPVLGTGETADEKIISAVRSTFRSTAESQGRDPRIAEAMVDPNVEVEGLIGVGQLLTLTSSEALQWDYADGIVANRVELISVAGFEGATVVETDIRLAERLVRFLTNPIIASLLISLGSLMIMLDLFSAGFGALGLVGIGMIGAFFWGHFIAGLAGWEGVALVVLGIALLAAEAFIVPGFGVAGILGIASLLGGMYMSLVSGEIVTDQAAMRAGITVGMTLVLLLLGGAILLVLLPKAGRFHSIVLQSQVGIPDVVPERRARRRWFRPLQPGEPAAPAVSIPTEPTVLRTLVGARGVAVSDLRPGGFAQIDSQRVDVVTQGDFIPAGADIVVIADEGYRRVVRRVESGE
jgi:membrane-bound serine protease (ClpP class)